MRGLDCQGKRRAVLEKAASQPTGRSHRPRGLGAKTLIGMFKGWQGSNVGVTLQVSRQAGLLSFFSMWCCVNCQVLERGYFLLPRIYHKPNTFSPFPSII